jgi:hypothetical protein
MAACAGVVTAALLYLATTQQAGVYEQALFGLGGAVLAGAFCYPVVSRPVIGIALLPPLAILPAVTIGPLTDASIAFVAGPVLVASWLLSRVARDRGVKLIRTPVFRPLGAFALAVLLAFVVGLYGWFGVPGASMAARLAGLGIFVTSISIMIVGAHELRNVRWLKIAVASLLIVGAAVLISALLNHLELANLQIVGQEKGVGSMFWTWLAALGFAQGILNFQLSPFTRLLCLLISFGVPALTMGLWMDWASGWAPACVAMGVTLALARPKTAAVVGLLLAMVLFTNVTVARDAAWSPDQIYSAKTRAAAAQTLVQIAKENPVTGFGPANYYYYTPLFPILGWYVRFSSHNNYFDLILQTGFLGLLCVGWLWYELGRMVWRTRKTVKSGFEQAYLYGAAGGLAGTIVAGALGDWFLPFVYNVGIGGMASSILAWIYLGGLVAVASLPAGYGQEAYEL